MGKKSKAEKKKVREMIAEYTARKDEVSAKLREVPVNGILALTYAYVLEGFKEDPEGSVEKASRLTRKIMEVLMDDFEPYINRRPHILITSLIDCVINIFVSEVAKTTDEAYEVVVSNIAKIKEGFEAAERDQKGGTQKAHDVAYR